MRRVAGALIVAFGLAGGAAAQTPPAPGLWPLWQQALKGAKYVDLTHPFQPVQAVWPGFGGAEFRAARAGADLPGFAAKGEAFTYDKHGFVATAYTLTTDQYGTQLDPPAHWDRMGATISDIPPTVSLRPLVVIDVSGKVAQDEGYHASPDDVRAWEARHGTIPEGAVVMIRSDWYKRWADVARFAQKPFPGITLAALKMLHEERKILFHGHEPLDTDTTPNLEGEHWLMHNGYMQAEGVAHLDKVPEAGALITIGFAKPLGGTGGYARYVAIAPADWPQGETIAAAPGAPLPKQTAPLVRDDRGVMRPTP